MELAIEIGIVNTELAKDHIQWAKKILTDVAKKSISAELELLSTKELNDECGKPACMRPSLNPDDYSFVSGHFLINFANSLCELIQSVVCLLP